MLMEYTCIICPNGCGLEAEIVDGKIRSIKGARCERGRMYIEQELSDPQRNIATSVLVEGGTLPLSCACGSALSPTKLSVRDCGNSKTAASFPALLL